MKKYFITVLMAVFAFASCSQRESYDPTLTVIDASFEQDASTTKLSISDSNILTWSEGDAFMMFGEGSSSKFTLTGGAGEATATFSGVAPSGIKGAAFPWESETKPYLDNNVLVMTLPSELDQTTAGKCNLPMWSATNSVESISFKHLAGVMRIRFSDIPSGYNTLEVKASNPIAGTFTVDVTADSPVLVASDEASNTVSVEFTDASDDDNDRVLYIPLPVGKYASIEVSVSNGVDTKELVTYNNKTVERAKIYTATLNYVDVDASTPSTEDALVEAIENGVMVTLKSNIALTKPLIVSKEVTIDLNGYVLSYTSDVAGDAMITNKGNLTIKDSGTNGKITYSYTGQPDNTHGKGNYTIYNYSKLTLGSGIIENTTAAMSHASYAISATAGSELIVNGGKILNIHGHAVRMASFGDESNTMIVNNGYIEGTRAVMMQLPSSDPSSAPEMNLEINGGELMSNEETYNLAVYVYSSGQSGENVSIEVSGGVMNGNIALNDAATQKMKDGAVSVTGGTINGQYGVYSYAADEVAVGKIAITGGTFATNYSETYAAPGYKFVEENGVYNVVYSAVAEVVYEDQSQTYGCLTLVDAIAKALEDGASVRVVKDILDIDADNTIVIPSGKTLVIDLNNHTVSGISEQVGSNRNMFDVKGTLTIKNGTVTYKHQGENMGWSSSTNVFNVTAGGVLNINDAAVKNLGGSDMGFCVHLNNWGEVTLNAQNVEFESNYVGIRVFNSGYDMNNVTLNNCSILSGSPCFWIHNYTSADFGNDESKVAAASARLNFSFSNTTVNRTNDSKSLVRFGFTDAIYYSDLNMTEVVAGTQSALVWALQNGKNVLLNNDITIENSLTIPVGKTVKLDLNGNDISYQVEGNNASAIFAVFGTLNLVSESEAVISYVAKDPDLQAIPSYATNTITNNGTLVIGENVVVKNESEGGASYAVDNHNNFTLDGGVLLGNRCALRIAKYNNPEVVFVMNSGEVKAKTPAWVQLPGSDSKVAPKISVTINGGTFESTKDTPSKDNDVLYTYSFGNSHANTKLVINGGKFLKGTVSIGSGYKGDAPSIEINGGKFDYDVVQWLENDASKVIYPAN